MASCSRCVTCPRCAKFIKVRDTQHFKQHGCRLQGWRCMHCTKEVPSDRSHDLRDHVKRRHPKEDSERIRPIWFYFRSESTAAAPACAPSATTTSSRRSSTPVPSPRQIVPPPRQVVVPPPKDEVIQIHIGDVSFMTDDSPVKLPSSVVKRPLPLSPVRSPVRAPPTFSKNSGRGIKKTKPAAAQGAPTTSVTMTPTTPTTSTTSTSAASVATPPPSISQQDVISYAANLDESAWEQLYALIMAARGVTGQDAVTQTHLLSRLGMSSR